MAGAPEALWLPLLGLGSRTVSQALLPKVREYPEGGSDLVSDGQGLPFVAQDLDTAQKPRLNLSFRYDVKATKTFCRDAAIAASWCIIVAAKATQWARFPHIHCLWGWRSVCPMRFSKPEVYVAWHHEQAMRRCSNLRPSEALGPVPTRALWGMLAAFSKKKLKCNFQKRMKI